MDSSWRFQPVLLTITVLALKCRKKFILADMEPESAEINRALHIRGRIPALFSSRFVLNGKDLLGGFPCTIGTW
jgi:hypothetical protein